MPTSAHPRTAPSHASVIDSDGDVPRSVGRVLDLLEFVLAEGACNLTSAAAASGLTPTTARRHLRALETRGYVDRDTAGVFSAGPTILRIAAALRDATPLDRLLASAQQHLDTLADETGESTYLAVSDGRRVTYVATCESPRAIRHVGWVGQQVPLDGTAVGAALAEPGHCVTRTGAVEPDITAISMALPPAGSMGIAVSIIGPAHRLADADRAAIEEALTRVVDALARDVGTVVEIDDVGDLVRLGDDEPDVPHDLGRDIGRDARRDGACDVGPDVDSVVAS